MKQFIFGAVLVFILTGGLITLAILVEAILSKGRRERQRKRYTESSK